MKETLESGWGKELSNVLRRIKLVDPNFTGAIALTIRDGEVTTVAKSCTYSAKPSPTLRPS